jgi:ATP-binding cassette subfamily B protein
MKRTDKDSEVRPKSRNLRPLRRLARFLGPYRVTLVAAMAVLALAAGTVLAFGQVIRQVVDHGLASGAQAELNQALALFLTVVVLMAISVAGRVYLVNWIGERVVADVRKAVFARVLSLDPTFFEVTRTGEVISRLTTDTSILQTVVGSTLAIAVRNTLLIVGGIVMLAFTSPKLTVLVLFGVPLVIAPLWLLGYRVRRLSRHTQDRVADVGAYIDETLHGIQTVQAFCHEAVDRKRYADRVESAFSTALRRSRLSALLTGVVILLMFGAIGIVLWTGGRDVLSGQLSGGELSAFVFYAVLVAGSVGALSEVAGELMRAAGAAERLMEILGTEPAIHEPQNPVMLPDPPLGRLEVEDITFHYPSRPDTPALDGFSLKITPGEKIALVGPSGAGKSTLFQLLLRFYDPQQGKICFDSRDLRTVSPSELRRRIALVPQDPVIFGADAWENIRFGFEGISDSEIMQAASAAHARAFLEELPDGLFTFLGERGVRLSGGQRQRIAIARAILRDPALLLLDEATSALDAQSEQLVQEALERLMRRRTTIIIAHRLATVRRVDRIVVMEQGRVEASGKHDELIAQGGLYSRLAALQFRSGKDDLKYHRIRETA